MTSELLIKSFFAVICSGILSWAVLDRYDEELGSEHRGSSRQRYLPTVPGALLPLFIAVIVGLALLIYGVRPAAHLMLSVCFRIFLHICLYYTLLLPSLPLLRRHISARACAMLWMIPNYLYLTQQGCMEPSRPLFVISAPEKLVWSLFFVWLAGFLAVFLWKLIAHLSFRSQILQDAVYVTDQELLDLWQAERDRAGCAKIRCRLAVSPHVTTPLTVGLFHRTTLVVLPSRDYTWEALTLILRHELIHICREDAWSKFFLVFCTAMCWFNPLMWIAMEKSAEDLELSCDETVLVSSEEDIRRPYAELILSTAGDSRGFTTCLSASAATMRYRLRNIMKPPKRHSGALTVGLTFFLLCMTCGYVTLAYGGGTGEDLIYASRDPAAFTLAQITRYDGPEQAACLCTDEAALHRYLASLTMEEFTGSYTFADEGNHYFFLCRAPEDTIAISLSRNFIRLVPLHDETRSAAWYYLPNGADLAYLDTLLIPQPE